MVFLIRAASFLNSVVLQTGFNRMDQSISADEFSSPQPERYKNTFICKKKNLDFLNIGLRPEFLDKPILHMETRYSGAFIPLSA